MRPEIFQIDAFTDRPFAGNPAAVVPLEREVDPDWAQAIAQEMNLSETAFFWPEGEQFRLRWWTPAAEVKLCGHATLATAHLLWESGRLAADASAEFETLSGRLACRKSAEGSIEMDFPARPAERAQDDDKIAAALGGTVVELHRSAEDLLVLLENEDAVRALAPDLAALGRLPVRGTIVTAVAGASTDADFVSRFFAPRFGVPEDPVTGSAHCVLAPFWADRLGRTEMTGKQVSRRGGTVGVRLAGHRVTLIGRAVTVLRGHLTELAAGGH